MNAAKTTISPDPDLLHRLDHQVAVEEKIARMQKTRLARECARLDPLEEQELANMGLSVESSQWPPY
jgi:hypothetical protein